MAEIFVTGHKNPDMDSICSAYCYADLKNQIDQEHTYVPIRCGHLNKQTKQVFQRLGIQPPQYRRDIKPRVRDIVKTLEHTLQVDSPVLDAVKMLSDRTLSVVPVFQGDTFKALLGIDEVTRFFIHENTGKRPVYRFLVNNFEKVVPGRFIKHGDRNELHAPIMTGAMPYGTSINRIGALDDLPILVVGLRMDIISFAIECKLPAIVITGITKDNPIDMDFDGYEGTIYLSYLDTAETIRLMRLSLPVETIISQDTPRIDTNDLFDDAKRLLVGSEYRGLPVFEQDEYRGFVTRRCFIDRPRKQAILVDHNELAQSIPGLEDADVVEIIDHHRLAAEKTRMPIYIAAEPVGCTCTIIFRHYIEFDIPISKEVATLMLSGILSDTVLLKSPTTTSRDVHAVERLALIAEIQDPIAYGEEIFSAGTSLADADPMEIILADFKEYSEQGCVFGIGQVEVTTLENIDELKERYIAGLEAARVKRRMDWAMLLITNVIKETSVLLMTPFQDKETRLAYQRVSEGNYLLPGVLSRKKQLLPEIIRVLEEV